MTMYYKPQNPGVMLETGFGQECLGANTGPLSKLTSRDLEGQPPSKPLSRFDNMVLEIWSDPEITAQTGYEYTRSIQFQCLGRAG